MPLTAVRLDKTVRITSDQKRAARRVAPEIVKDYLSIPANSVETVILAAMGNPFTKLCVEKLHIEGDVEFEYFHMDNEEGVRVTSQRQPKPRYYRLLSDK